MYKIKGTDSLYINDEFFIVDNGTGKTLLEDVTFLENGKVEIVIYKHRMVLELESLYYIAKTNMYIEHEKIYKNLNLFYFVTRKRKNMDVTITKHIALLTTPITINHHGTIYRIISTNTRYAIAMNGVVLDIATNSLKYSRGVAEGYPTVSLLRYDGETSARLLHRLKAIAWVPNDDWNNKVIVNHKDGDKTNHTITNLEWCTYEYNNRHATEIGLRTDNRFIKIRNIETEEILEFPSITLATEYMKRSRINIQHTNPIGTGKILITPKGKFELKYKDDTSPWMSESNRGSIIIGAQKTRMLIALDSGVYICNTIDDIKTFIADNPKYSIDISPNSDFIVVAEKLKRNNKELAIDIISLQNNKDLTYICLDNTNDEITPAKTRKEIMDITGGTKSAIQKSIITNGAYIVNTKWRIKYDDGKPFAPLANIANKRVAVQATGATDTIKFSSNREASYFFKVDKKTIVTAIKNKTLIRGYLISYA